MITKLGFNVASNPAFHERTKHVKIHYHFVRDKVLSGEIITNFDGPTDQLADIFTNSLRGSWVESTCNKLDVYGVHAPVRGGALEFITCFV